MKAWLLKDVNQFEFELDYPLPSVGEDEVLVRVINVGICGSDIQRVYETGAHIMPLIIGHEFSGKIVKVGHEKNNSLLNKRVGIFPLIPCRCCNSCKKKEYELCRQYSYLGSRENGGFAEYVCVPIWNIIELPDQVNFKQAAMLEPMSVAVHAIRRLNIKPEDKIVVYGAGTIGLLITMFLKERGYSEVYVIGSKEIQREKCIELGIDEKHYHNALNEDVKQWVKNHVSIEGADVIFECVGKKETIENAIDLSAYSGKICLVGNPYTDIELSKNVYWKILRRELTIKGTWNSSFLGQVDSMSLYDDWHYVLKKLIGKKINPEILITHRFSMQNIEKGFELMRKKSEEYIKVMMDSECFEE